MVRILQMIQKEFRQIFRDRPMMGIIFVIPLVQLLILAFAITTDVKHLKMSVLDYDKSAISREIIRAFSHTERFDIVEFSDDFGQIDHQMRAWQTQMALVIPPNFSKDLQRGGRPQVHISVDGVDGNSAGIALGYAQAILLKFGSEALAKPAIKTLANRPHFLTMIGII